MGPILNQELHQIPEKCTADKLGAALAFKGAHLVSLVEHIQSQKSLLLGANVCVCVLHRS